MCVRVHVRHVRWGIEGEKGVNSGDITITQERKKPSAMVRTSPQKNLGKKRLNKALKKSVVKAGKA